MITTVLFDLDGTLVDTELAAERAIRECFAEWRIKISESDVHVITGRTWGAAFDYLFDKYRMPSSTHAHAAHQILETYREALKTDLQLVPGGADCVRALSGSVRLGLVSGSHRREIHWALDRLKVRELFEVILGAEDYPASKPAPDGYLKAMQMLNAKAEETLVFEDSGAGIASGRAAGAWVVSISGTNHHLQDTTLAHESIPNLMGIDASWIQAFASRWI